MTFYAKPSPDLVYDLINKANPGLPVPITKTVARLGLPSPIPGAGPSDLNTTVKASANRGGGYNGTRILSYRRINLSDFFRGTVVIVNKYKLGGQPGKFSDYLDDFNIRYGFSLTVDDFTDVNFPASTVDPTDNRKTAAVVVNTKGDSLGFTGAFTFRWKDAPQELKNVIIKPELPGRVYPASNFVGMATYGGDVTAILSEKVPGTPYVVFDYFSDQLVFLSRPDLLVGHQQFITSVNREFGTSFIADLAVPASTQNSLLGTVIGMGSLPSALYPQANNDFKRLIVLKLQSGNTWGTGDLFFHHNYGA